jgi:hypothetical protein
LISHLQCRVEEFHVRDIMSKNEGVCSLIHLLGPLGDEDMETTAQTTKQPPDQPAPQMWCLQGPHCGGKAPDSAVLTHTQYPYTHHTPDMTHTHLTHTVTSHTHHTTQYPTVSHVCTSHANHTMQSHTRAAPHTIIHTSHTIHSTQYSSIPYVCTHLPITQTSGTQAIGCTCACVCAHTHSPAKTSGCAWSCCLAGKEETES